MQLVSLYGKPLTGKGTQAKFFVQQGFYHLPTGDYMRERAAQGDPECLAVMSIIKSGGLVSDELVCGIVARVVDEKRQQGYKGILLDGFPRTVPQAQMLDDFAAARNMPLTVIELKVEDNNVLDQRRLKRIGEFLARGEEPRAEDLDVDAFKTRIDNYDRKTAPVAGHYRTSGQLVEIDGLLPPQTVWGIIKSRLNLGNGPVAPRLSL
jgi:adenylate kinase